MWNRMIVLSSAILAMGLCASVIAESKPSIGGSVVPAAPKTMAALSAGVEPVKVVCFGDSVTGVYYHTGGRRAYADMLEIALERLYPEANVAVVNAGISGHTTADGLARMEADVLRHKPQLVTVMFGLNDMTRVPLDAYKANLATIIQRCRDIDAEVVLCTPNSVYDTATRPVTKLEEYCAAMREVGQAQGVPVVDCYEAYEAVRAENPMEWALLMSEDIHPSMNGHKLFAEAIAQGVSARSVSLDDVGFPVPAMPKTLALIEKGEPVKVCAMAPCDQFIEAVLKQLSPRAQVDVRSWPVAGKTIAEIEQASKEVRKMGMDLVVLAVPAGPDAETAEQYLRSYSWIMNYALSFGFQEWDCFVVLPSVTKPELSPHEQERAKLARRAILGQDLGFVEREPGDVTPAEDLLANWIAQQAELKKGEK